MILLTLSKDNKVFFQNYLYTKSGEWWKFLKRGYIENINEQERTPVKPQPPQASQWVYRALTTRYGHD